MHQIYLDTFSTKFCNIPAYCALQATNYPPTPTPLAETVAIMAHNKGLELGADMVLLLGGWGCRCRNNTVRLLELLLEKVSYSWRRVGHTEWPPARLPNGKPVISLKMHCMFKRGILREGHKGGVVERWAEHRISFFLSCCFQSSPVSMATSCRRQGDSSERKGIRPLLKRMANLCVCACVCTKV